MTASFDVDLEMGASPGKSSEDATTGVLTIEHVVEEPKPCGYDDYGVPQADASDSMQGNGKQTDGEGVPVDYSYDNTSRKMWNLNHAEPKKYDGAIFKSREDHIESILLFTGLFSATVLLFVIENYKLAPDPGEQTVTLFNQVSQQLVGISRGTPLGLPPLTDSIMFRPNPPAVRARILWFLSLGLNITCAIWAMLWQPWWRRYIGLLRPHRRPRVRAYLFSGIGRFGMDRTVEMIWMLLQTSVLFFFIGIVDFLFPINKTVAWVFLGSIVPLALVYIATALLPRLISNSHYFAPSSSGLGKVSQLDNRRPENLPPFPLPYIGENLDREHRDHQVAAAHNTSNDRS